MLLYIVILVLIFTLLILLLRSYLHTHYRGCSKQTDCGIHDTCTECDTEHEARVAKHREESAERIRSITREVFERSEAEIKEFGFSDYELLDKPCSVCVTGQPKSHREIFRERGLAGNPQACWDFIWNTHFPLSKKAHKKRESKKFWKKWLYVPPTPQEEEAVGRISWMLKNILIEEPELRKHRAYREEPDHWMHMTTKQLLERRLARIKSAFGIREA